LFKKTVWWRRASKVNELHDSTWPDETFRSMEWDVEATAKGNKTMKTYGQNDSGCVLHQERHIMPQLPRED